MALYIRSIDLDNTGPIRQVTLKLPFEGTRPKPVVIVGANGSGKSTILSFIVNALLAFKQHAFENIEIEKGRVYRIRSPLGIQANCNFYRSKVDFGDGLFVSEWQLDRPKSNFEDELQWTPIHKDWTEIVAHDTSHLNVGFGPFTAPHKMEEAFNSNCVLFFGADRFEPPDWLNSQDLSLELKLTEAPRIKGHTIRRVIARNRLKPTIEWLASVLLDVHLHDYKNGQVFKQIPGSIQVQMFPIRFNEGGPSTSVFTSVLAILREILSAEPNDQLELFLSDRRARLVSVVLSRNGQAVRIVRDLLSLSAGESSLFCMFAAIIFDADGAGKTFTNTDELTGIVTIDEVDLHLHINLQYRVVAKLISLFPKIQFVMTAHSPLLVMGMEETFGNDGFLAVEMPLAEKILPETYSEFNDAFLAFTKTRKFESYVVQRANAQPKPVLLVEGLSDEILLKCAWGKLHGIQPIPFEIIPCGFDPTPESRGGGAEMLRRCVEFLAIASERTILALFDNDREGNEQFKGLNRKAFDLGINAFEKPHKSGRVLAFLLPVPPGRELFVTASNITQRYLEIEHYFSDSILQSNGKKGPPVLGSTVFEITGDKVAFAKNSSAFGAQEFSNFELIFSKSEAFIATQTPAVVPALAAAIA